MDVQEQKDVSIVNAQMQHSLVQFCANANVKIVILFQIDVLWKLCSHHKKSQKQTKTNNYHKHSCSKHNHLFKSKIICLNIKTCFFANMYYPFFIIRIAYSPLVILVLQKKDKNQDCEEDTIIIFGTLTIDSEVTITWIVFQWYKHKS